MKMDLLLCCERLDGNKHAYEDPVLIEDIRVLENLLRIEDQYLPTVSHLKCIQTDITTDMRKIVADWMLQVCCFSIPVKCKRSKDIDGFRTMIRGGQAMMWAPGKNCVLGPLQVVPWKAPPFLCLCVRDPIHKV